jgi:hypothetical protein
MSRQSTQTAAAVKTDAGNAGQGAPVAAASSAVKKPAAVASRPKAAEPATREGVQTGEPIDAALEADIFRELGGKPESAESDTEHDETEATAEGSEDSGASDEAEANEEAAATDDAETEATTAEAEGDTETEATEEGAEAEEEPEAVPKWAEKRFAELTRQIKERDREITGLKQAAPAGTPPRAPLGLEAEILQASTPEQLGALRQRFDELEDLALANPDGLEIPGKREGDEPAIYTREQMSQLRINARRAIRLLPEREQQIKVGQQYERAAHEAYPGFDNPESEEAQSAAYLLQVVPELRRYPAWKQLVGDALVTERARLAKAKASATANKTVAGKPLAGKPVVKAAARPPAVPGKPSRAPVVPLPKAQQLTKARERLARSGSEADVANLLELTLSR